MRRREFMAGLGGAVAGPLATKAGRRAVASIARWFLCTSAAAALAMMSVQGAGAQGAEQIFYRGKTVRMLVGAGVGGGYDGYARMIAPVLSQALGATVIVENQPAAGGIAALNRMAANQADDPSIMLAHGTRAVLAQLGELPGVRYDLSRLGILATVTISPDIWLVGPNSTAATLDDVLRSAKRIKWGGRGPAEGLTDGAGFTCAALKLDCHIVSGYSSSNEAALAVTRGEVDAVYVADSSANNYVNSGQNRALVAMGRERPRFFPNVPTIFEAVKLTPEQESLFRLRTTIDSLGRILVVGPNMPPARLAFLQAAVRATLTDPALIAAGERTQRYIDYVDGEITRTRVLEVVTAITPEQRALVKAILTRAN
jgi:tripartite-type tricarboxylate transporter receptor subunit TctC